MNHDEELIFIAGLGVAVSGGHFVPVPPVSPETYQSAIAAVLGVSDARAAAVAAEYPPALYGGELGAMTVLVSDANFACPALQVDRWTSRRVPTFAYEFDDDTAPQRFVPPEAHLPAIATHSSEIQYLFDQPNTPVQATLDPTQAQLADVMQTAWASFAASGNPATVATPWPSFSVGSQVLSFISPQSQVVTTFSATHHCAFWES
jgi:para-nitrobenzyl esterase